MVRFPDGKEENAAPGLHVGQLDHNFTHYFLNFDFHNINAQSPRRDRNLT